MVNMSNWDWCLYSCTLGDGAGIRGLVLATCSATELHPQPFFHVEAGSFRVAQAGLTLVIFLPQPLRGWAVRHAPSHLSWCPSEESGHAETDAGTGERQLTTEAEVDSSVAKQCCRLGDTHLSSQPLRSLRQEDRWSPGV